MRKIILGFVVGVIIGLSAYVYLENSKKNNSYATPEEALINVENPKLDVLEIIETKLYDSVAYVFYYSKAGETPKNYLAAGKLNKNKYGWQFEEILGVGNIEKSNAGMASGKEDYIVGLASKKVHKVSFKNHEANMVTMENKDMKAFLFHEVEVDLMGQAEFEYFDEEGNKLFN